jgi:phytoene dehydrogenase-like protein
MSKVIVIGAGHGGLAVGARLAVKGHDVHIYEASSSAVTIPQVLTLPAAFRDLFIKTGGQLEEVLELKEPNFAFEFQTKSSGIIQVPASGVGRVLSEIEKVIDKDAANQWRNFTAVFGQIWQKSRSKLIESESEEPLWKIVGFKSYLKIRNFEKFIKQQLKNTDLQNLARAYKSQCYVDLDSKIGLLGICSYVHQTFGVYQPSGGLSALTNALENRCRKLGVEITFNEKVAPVVSGTQLIGVELSNGQLVAADYVIVNDLTSLPEIAKWTDTTTPGTNSPRLYRIEERSWLGLGPSHAVMSAEIVADLIGSAAP